MRDIYVIPKHLLMATKTTMKLSKLVVVQKDANIMLTSDDSASVSVKVCLYVGAVVCHKVHYWCCSYLGYLMTFSQLYRLYSV
jgi:hypothetical protein